MTNNPLQQTTAWLAAILLAVLSLIIPGSAAALETDTQALHLKITSLDRAAPPEVWEDYVIFTYNAKTRTRSVSAAFEHEDYRISHTYMKNDKGIFFLTYPLPNDREHLTYRIIVDGLWMHDKTCPTTVQDSAGIKQSRIPLPSQDAYALASPVITDSRVTFTLHEAPGLRVFVMGDFNQWDPFLHAMREVKPGLYQMTLSLLPGQHYYNFIVEGKEIKDPLNYEQAFNYEGRPVSVFFIEEPTGLNQTSPQTALR